jgi:septum formation protein
VKLCLASASPRRADLLRQAGVEVVIVPADIDESLIPGETAESYVKRLAQAKATAVADASHGLPVLAADTVVVLRDQILGKPVDEQDAVRMLSLLSGSSHRVMTGFCVWDSGNVQTHCCTTQVEFRTLSEAEILAYVATGEPMDKAGAYGIQAGAAHLVKRIEGSYTNVVGLPMAEVMETLKSLS